jgi:hypothetical protein
MNSAHARRTLCGPPLPYSLALRLPDAGVADVICQYVNVEQAGLDPLPHRRSETPSGA